MKHHRILSILLALIIASSVACGSKTENQPQGDNGSSGASTDADTKAPLPDYGGKEFTILHRTEMAYEFDIAEETGDLVSDAIFRRNQKVEEDYNVDLKYLGVEGSWNVRDIFDKFMTGSIMSNDGSFDVVAGYQACMVTPAMNGLFLNINDIPEIDQSKPWWSEKCTDSLTLNNCLFMITGDISISMWDGLYCMYFNKTLADDYKVGDMYSLVKDGKWTMDKLLELSSLVSDDLNGDSKFDENDRFGFVSRSLEARNYLVTLKTPILTPDKDGFMELTFYNERSQTAAEKIADLFTRQSSLKTTTADAVFVNGQSLFLNSFLSFATKNRDSETDFGIIPCPMLDEKQGEYLTSTQNGVSMMCFPISLNDTGMAGTIIEALCREANSIVIPEYYEKTLKTKGARDDASQEMIDIIRDSLIFDFGWVHSMEIGTFGTVYEQVAVGNNLATHYASMENTIKSGVEKINDAYRNYGK